MEECDNNILSNRESYWIEYYNTYKDGYNATLGGDGKQYVDENKVIELYKKLQNQVDVAKKMGICKDTVGSILKRNNINVLQSADVQIIKSGKIVLMISKQGETLQEFLSINSAAQYLVDNNYTKPHNKSGLRRHIVEVCNGNSNRKTVLGFIWKYKE